MLPDSEATLNQQYMLILTNICLGKFHYFHCDWLVSPFNWKQKFCFLNNNPINLAWVGNSRRWQVSFILLLLLLVVMITDRRSSLHGDSWICAGRIGFGDVSMIRHRWIVDWHFVANVDTNDVLIFDAGLILNRNFEVLLISLTINHETAQKS